VLPDSMPPWVFNLSPKRVNKLGRTELRWWVDHGTTLAGYCRRSVRRASGFVQTPKCLSNIKLPLVRDFFANGLREESLAAGRPNRAIILRSKVTRKAEHEKRRGCGWAAA
jgi:hypothetical protein